MNAPWKIALVLGLALLTTRSAPAQGFRGGSFFVVLLQNAGVRKELKLTDEQAEKAKQLAQKVLDKYRNKNAENDKDQEEATKKIREIDKIIAEETIKELAGVLQPEQIKRLDQIALQQRGIQAFQEVRVEKALKLTAEQKNKIKTLNADATKEMRELFQSVNGDFQEAMKKIHALRKANLDKAAAVLTDDQKKIWKEMTGAPFEAKFEPRRPR